MFSSFFKSYFHWVRPPTSFIRLFRGKRGSNRFPVLNVSLLFFLAILYLIWHLLSALETTCGSKNSLHLSQEWMTWIKSENRSERRNAIHLKRVKCIRGSLVFTVSWLSCLSILLYSLRQDSLAVPPPLIPIEDEEIMVFLISSQSFNGSRITFPHSEETLIELLF